MAGTGQLPALVADPVTPPASGNYFYFVGSQLRSMNAAGTVTTYGVGLTTENVQDIVGGFFTDSTSLDVTYNDAGDVISASVNKSMYEVVTATSQAIVAAAIIIDFATEFKANADFSVSGTGVVTCNFTDDVEVYYKIPVDSATGTRSISRSAVFINGAEQVKSRGYAYHRTTADGEGASTSCNLFSITTGQTIDVRTLSIDGVVSNTISGEGVLKITRLFV